MVPPEDPESFRDAVLESLNRSDAQAALAITKGRERAEAFRIGNRIDAMTRLFTKLMREH
jgi:hypothetical protein